MPRRPAASGYARIAQAEEEEEEEGYQDDPDDESLIRSVSRRISIDPHYESIQPGNVPRMQLPRTKHDPDRRTGRRHRRQRTNSGVDIKAINARLEKWADEIAAKFRVKKIKGKTPDEEKLEIHYSVFQPPEGMRTATADELASGMLDTDDKMKREEFEDVLESVKVAIELGVQPKMITQGSSGSYFARNSEAKVVGVFKPKDEEPYASKNPKWTKWIHRNLFPCCFGRACLIPNLSYVSEAAAYVLDTRLQTNLVPYTDIVHLSSISFNYDFWDRKAYYRKRKALPDKVGSFQVFLKGFKDANIFLKEHPWPDQANANLPKTSANKRGSRGWGDECRTGRMEVDAEEAPEPSTRRAASSSRQRRSFWTDELQQSFREELEKLVILDYIMRNTDRGLDNWMIRIDEETQKASIVTEAPRSQDLITHDDNSQPYQQGEDMTMNDQMPSRDVPKQSVRIGAIDNSLSWPWKHPDAWRSFPFGWLFLPVTLIGRPFSENTKRHFLPLLTSKQWWSETQIALRNCFQQDSDFQERMFARQMAVVKGQAFNVVETLKTPDHGPLELTRRTRVCVWDDLVDVPVALPLRTPSAEMSRQMAMQDTARQQPEEMDISAARAANTSLDGALLAFNKAANGIPMSNRLDLSRQGSQDDVRNAQPGRQSEDIARQSTRPIAPRSKTRLSFEEPTRSAAFTNRKKRNLSFSHWRVGEQDDSDGDLGYSAARGMEGSHRKVIVERLETVKSKNPVFTWC
ncbi:MAG: phosphatidyl inositol kinase [Chrysothrix sp. TS-e1954]|nr:MAG: phosphatidyl inositol kinase [Chrysothrix sp. TS-e1954]